MALNYKFLLIYCFFWIKLKGKDPMPVFTGKNIGGFLHSRVYNTGRPAALTKRNIFHRIQSGKKIH